LCCIYPQETAFLLYPDCPKSYTWDKSTFTWRRRRTKTKAVSRVYFASPIQGELYYLRILLYNIPGPTSYEYLRTYSGTIYNTFHAACGARGLIETDDEWDRCLEEAASFQTGSQFRQLFVTLLLMNNPFDPLALFDRHFQALSDDCRYLLQYRFHIDSPTDQAIISLTLQKLADIFEKAGKSLQDYKLPLPSVTLDELNGIPGMIAQELTYDRALLARQWNEGYCHGLRGSGLARLRARRPVTQIFRFRLVLLGTPPPSSDP